MMNKREKLKLKILIMLIAFAGPMLGTATNRMASRNMGSTKNISPAGKLVSIERFEFGE